MQEFQKLARNIFESGQLIQDRIFRVRAAQLETIGERQDFESLTVAQLHAILMIHMRSQVSVNELSNLLGVSPPSASVMVDRLVEKGILRRRHSKKDRRKVEIRISSKAVEHIQGVEEAILESFAEIVEKIGPETAQKWCDVLEKVKPVLEQDASNFTRS
ncbi:MAG: MarR family transcriptional regulator [Deltaproteobacteria bacterium]|nr:MarR family transcriptional regulator [Deltaproteobacteria bacterium]